MQETDLRFEIIDGLISEVISDDAWYTEVINSVFGQCLLFYDDMMVANIGIYDGLMVFTCCRGDKYQINVDLHKDTSGQIRNILDHLLKFKNQYPI